ncbi:MAG: alkyl hydroperoxide reductase [Legionellaceae bacterium]|nr:alkyl hydroperoxide reductase [Legionellaceae bacterium]HAF88076.1 alkyl hydroperoxide reductase [Legionellales bacterium]HCA89660.1 alkyl hydroperoxide reductase [Legionellales bacterium]|tara:strand:+ start:43 stop:648 length:606 start_codon:yes stop_codon:yes gene_type:complete
MSVLVGRKAPDFTVSAVLGDGEITDKFNLYETLNGQYGVVFFYPLDFTFVCPSELIALNNRMAAFRERQTQVIAVSIDSQFTHNAYRNTPVESGGIGPVEFTLAADINHTICQSYGIEHPGAGVAFRAAFIIDKAGMVRAQIVNDLPIGRNIDEIIRLIDAVQFFEEHGEVCPAGWSRGEAGMKASSQGVADYLAAHSKKL